MIRIINKKGRSPKWVFFESFILAVFVFALGVAIGFYIESSRLSKVAEAYAQSELDLLDLKIQSQVYDLVNINCQEAIASNEAFADRVYEEAKTLDNYERAQRLSDSLMIQHKKYDLLRALFWLNSMKIKEKCNASYHNVVYFYQYNEPNVNTKAMQSVFSEILRQVKEEKGSDILLIPIAGDINSASVSALMGAYGIESLPTILIDEKIRVTDVKEAKDVLELLK